MKRSTWIWRCAVMALFLLLTNSFVALALLRSFTSMHRGLLLSLYAAAVCLIIICFRRIRSTAPYPVRCLGAYGMGLFIAVSMTAPLAFFLPGWLWLSAALGLAVCSFFHARKIAVKRYTVPIRSEPFRLVLISDVHIGAVGSEERLPKLAAAINAEKPDFVCIAGDLIDNCFEAIRDPERAAALVRSIESRCGVYACLGNHDAGESAAAMEAFMEAAGIHVLKEQYVTIGTLQLLGRLDGKPHGDYVNSKRRDTAALLGGNPRPDLPLIVLDHNPSVIPQYGDCCTLLLCGHTHNGQIFPGNLVVRAINICGYGYYRKDANSPHVVVSSGAGAWGPPMRIGTDCEIVVIELGT